MSDSELKQLAHSKKLECIFGDAETVCIRPMLFNDDGKRLVRFDPDPVEFIGRRQAVHMVKKAKGGAL